MKFLAKTLAAFLTVAGIVGVPLSIQAGRGFLLIVSSVALIGGILWLGKLANE